MWRSRAVLPDNFVFSASASTELGARVFISVVLGVGMTYTILILVTLTRFGPNMESAWWGRIDEYSLKHEWVSGAEVSQRFQGASSPGVYHLFVVPEQQAEVALNEIRHLLETYGHQQGGSARDPRSTQAPSIMGSVLPRI